MSHRRPLLAALSLLSLVPACGHPAKGGPDGGHPKDMAHPGSDMGDGGTSGFTVGGTVSGLIGSGLVLQDSGAQNLTIMQNGAFTFANGLADGAAYDVTVLTQPTSPSQVCSVVKGKGTIAAANVTDVTVRCSPVARYLLATDQTDDSVSTYAIDSGSGRVRYIGKQATGAKPLAVAVDAAGKFAYVANSMDGTISQFAVGAGGNLTALAPATVNAGTGPRALAVDPTGSYLYVANSGGGNVSQYTIGTGGALTAMATPTETTGAGPAAIAVDSSGRYAYVANSGDGNVSQFTITAGGALMPMPSAVITAGAAPSAIAVDPSGSYVYVANSGSGNVSQFAIGASGALSAMGGVLSGSTPSSLVVDPSGAAVYVVNSGDKNVAQFALGAMGALTPLSTATVGAGTGAAAIVVDPAGRYAWVANTTADDLSQYVVGTGGALAANAPATVPGQQAPSALALVGGAAPATASAVHAYVTDQDGSVEDFAVAAAGTLTATTSTATAGHLPQSIALDPSGQHAYVLDDPLATAVGNVLQYSVNPTSGAWSALTPATVAAGYNPGGIAIHPSGRYAYITNSDTTMGNTVTQMPIKTDGTLDVANASTVASGKGPIGVAMHPSGRFVYVANSGDTTANGVSQYTVGSDLKLTAMATATVTSGVAPQRLAVDPSGRWLYVGNSGGHTISQYAIDAGDGHLSALSTPTISTGTTPEGIAVDPSGRYVYAVDNKNCRLYEYAIGSDGTLSASTPPYVAAGDCAVAMENIAFVGVDPSGGFVYVPVAGMSSSRVLQWSLGAGGVLAPLSPPATAAVNTTQFQDVAFLARWQ